MKAESYGVVGSRVFHHQCIKYSRILLLQNSIMLNVYNNKVRGVRAKKREFSFDVLLCKKLGIADNRTAEFFIVINR